MRQQDPVLRSGDAVTAAEAQEETCRKKNGKADNFWEMVTLMTNLMLNNSAVCWLCSFTYCYFSVCADTGVNTA